MKSDKVEYIRFDDLSTGVLMGDKPYILAQGDFQTLREVRTPMGQIELLQALAEHLRYDAQAGQSLDQKWATIKKCSDQINSFFIDLDNLSEDITHVEIFLNPSELALIPFELILNTKDEPRFISKNGKPLLLTRNFRRSSSSSLEIPKKPRVLFAHARPDHKNFLGLPFPDVPYKNHEQSLRYALRHWDSENQLSVLANPTFEEFKMAIQQAEQKGNPFTHIHLLAHGSLLFDYKNPAIFEYGIAFHSKEELDISYKATSTEEIKTLFGSLTSLPYLVNYMICDGANFTNGTKPDKNPVQATFKAGVPIVIGSQFPLSMDGANLITKELYKNLFRGGDIRTILGDIRTKLYTSLPAELHDWISLVNYVELPDDYEFQLLLLKLEFQLAILNSIRTKVLTTETDGLPSNDDFIRAKMQIEEAMADLSALNMEIEHEKTKEAAFLENCGLLGSAYKRLAEIEFKEAHILKTDTWSQQLLHLREAQKWYGKAAGRNLSHHWSLIQYISLCVILDGGLPKNESDYWSTARLAAHKEIELNDAKGVKSVWPFGSLLELYLLTTKESQGAKMTINEYAQKLLSNAKNMGNIEAITSTRFQLERYLEWWTAPKFKTPETFCASDKTLLQSLIVLLDS